VAFDLGAIRDALAASPLASPYPFELSAAIVNDTLRMALARPPSKQEWTAWRRQRRKLWEEQLGMLAHALAVSSLRQETVAALPPGFDALRELPGFFDQIEPLTAEMIRSNRFRQEEFLRRWIARVGGAVAGERARQSRQRLEQLDYRKTLAEYAKAQSARKAEAAKRAAALRAAAEREAQARGWRE
jgi:hypothetical protein